MKSWMGRVAAVMAYGALLAPAGVASAAGNSISADRPGVSSIGGGCRLGSSCAGYDLTPGGFFPAYTLAYPEAPAHEYGIWGGYRNDYDRVSTDPYTGVDVTESVEAYYRYFASPKMYVYDEGVVSFGAPLPGSASLEGGTASFGSGTWFAPALGDATNVQVFYDGVTDAQGNTGTDGQYRINWGQHVGDYIPPVAGVDYDPKADCPDRPDCADYVDGRELQNQLVQPAFQLFLSTNGAAYGLPEAIFGYSAGYPGGRTQAFNYNPLDHDEHTEQVTYDYYDSHGVPHTAAAYSANTETDHVHLFGAAASLNAGLPGVPGGIPEPGAWTLMLLGFGGLGTVLRVRRARSPA